MGYAQLFWIFFKVGLFSIGGGYAMIPMINTELVSIGVIDSGEIYDLIAISQMTPGAFALNSATFCGMKILGFGGAVVATLALILPSAIITTTVAIFFYKVRDKQVFKRIFSALKPIAIALILSTVIKMVMEQCLGILEFNSIPEFIDSIKNIDFDILQFFVSIILAGVSAFLIIKFKIHPVFIVVGSAIVGILVYGFI